MAELSLDLLLLAVLVVSMLLGAWRGLVFEVLSLLGWVLAFYAAQYAAPAVAVSLPAVVVGEPVRYAAAFILVFVIAAFVAGLFTHLLKKMVQAVGLRPVDRSLGVVFGLLRGVVLLLAVTVVVNMTALKSSAIWQASIGAGWLTSALGYLQPLLPAPFSAYLAPFL